MPFGFFTIERWVAGKRGGKSRWVTIAHVDARRSLSDALAEIETRGKPGFFRVVQTQRVV
jgi:hypothetical protein